MTQNNPNNPYAGPWGHTSGAPSHDQPQRPVIQGSNGLAIAGLVLALIGGMLFWAPFIGVLLAFIGLVMSGFGLRNAGRYFGGRGRGVAISGLICGTLGTLAGGGVTTFATVVGYYTGLTMEPMVRVHDRIERHLDEHGELPLSLSELSFSHGANDAFGNGLLYVNNGDGTYTISARGVTAIGQFVQQLTGLTYDSDTGAIHMAFENQIFMTKESVDLLRKQTTQMSQAFDSDVIPLDELPRQSNPKSAPAPESPEGAEEDF